MATRKNESTTYRNSAAFGKRIEHYLIGRMIKEGLGVYIPMVDDDAIDAVAKREDGQYVEIQIKARSNDVKFGNAALFAAISHEPRDNYWFLFYSERMDETWILSSAEFIKNANQNKSGNTEGKYVIHLNGKNIKENREYTQARYEQIHAKTSVKIKN